MYTCWYVEWLGIVTSVDCVVLSWFQWKNVLQLPQSHKKGVTCITGIMVSETDAIFASTSSDGSVYIWEVVLPTTPGGRSEFFAEMNINISLCGHDRHEL